MASTAGERRGLMRRLFGRPGRGGDPADLAANLEAAVAAHEAWKARLVEAVIVGRSSVEPAVASLDDQCPFGVWLYRETDRKTRESPHYEYIRRLHGRFHEVAGGILGLAVDGHTHEAMYGVRLGGEFDEISERLVGAINEWRGATGAG